MRAKILCPPMILLLLLCLTACQAKVAEADQLALEAREAYQTAGQVAGQMTVTADYGRRVYEYGVDFTWTPLGEVTLALTSPQEVAGITAGIAQAETYLSFEDARLETGPMGTDGLSPLDGLSFLLDGLTQGYLAECDLETLGEREALRLCRRDPELSPGQGTEGVLWLDQDNWQLLRGEVRSQGTTIITCQFGENSLTPGEEA